MPLGNSGGNTGASANAIKAGEAFVELSARDTATAIIERFGNRLRSIGMGMAKFGAITTAAGLGIITPMLGVMQQALEYGDKFQKAADRTGGTSEAMQRLGMAAEMADSSLESVVNATMILTRNAIAAEKGLGGPTEAFNRMNISASEFLRLDTDKQFLRIAQTADTITDPLERSQFLISLLGRQALELGSLFRSGSAGIQAVFNDADKFLLSGEDTSNAAAVSDAISTIMKALKVTILESGFALLGFSGEIRANVDTIVIWIKNVRDWIRENRRIVVTVFAVGAALVALGIAITAAGLVLSSFVTIISTLISVGSTVIATVFSPLALKIAIVTVAILAGAEAFRRYTDEGAATAANAKQLWSDIQTDTVNGIQGIVAAIQKGDITLAWKILTKTLKLLWLDLQIFIQKQWNMTKSAVVDGLKTLQTRIATGIATAMAIAEYALTGFDQTRIGEIEENRRRQLKLLDEDLQNDLAGRDAARNAALQELLDEQTKLKNEQARLIAQAMQPKPAGAAQVVGLPGRPPESGPILDRLGDAVRGLLYGRNFSGALAIGPGSDTAKNQLKVQMQMKDILQNIEDKINVPVFN